VETNYKIGDNGKPRVNFSKEYKGLTQYNIHNGKFNIGKVTLFLAEYKINSLRGVGDRSFIISLRQDGRGRDIGEYKQSQMKFNKDELMNVRDNINKMLNEEIEEDFLLGCEKKYTINYFKGGSYKESTANGKYIETVVGTLINYDNPFTGRFFLRKDNGSLEIIPMASVIEMRQI